RDENASVASYVFGEKKQGRNIWDLNANHGLEGRLMKPGNVLRAKTLALAIAIGTGGPATAVRADELQDLKAQLEALKKKVGELEMKQETAEKKEAAVADNVVTGGATKGSFKLPGLNTS